MYSIKKSSSQPSKSGKTLSPGTYQSTVLSIDDVEGYVDNAAFRLSYELVDDKGGIFTHSEVFFTESNSKRNSAFFDYLVRYGIPTDAVDELVGCKEVLYLQYEVKNGWRFLNIVDREFVSHPDGEVTDLGI